MRFWGKIIGGVAGFVVGGPLGNLVCATLGINLRQALDRYLEEEPIPDPDATREVGFTIGVIALAAKMAKADGEVTREEVAAFHRMFHVPPDAEAGVIRFFDVARRTPVGFESYARQLAKLLADRPAVLEQVLDCLMEIAAADGRVTADELSFLRQVAGIFGIDGAAFARWSAAHRAGWNDDGGADAYAVLGLDESADDATVRATYRLLVREHHPDRLVGEGLPPAFVDAATRKLAAINAAYGAVARARGLR